MREIKFRAWSKRNGYFIKQEMLSEPGFNKNDTQFINDIFKDVGYVFMQYTGLNDKNGREIYEKDVLDVQGIGYPFVSSWKGIVKFIDGSYLIENLEGTDGEYLFDETREVEIIGNIYEDAQLLGELR